AQRNYPATLLAVNKNTGQTIWTWTPPGVDGSTFHYPDNTQGLGEAIFLGSPIVTNNLVFVSTNLRVYAIDLATHQVAWVYPHPGPLALSANGILYVTRSMDGAPTPRVEGTIAAINLH